MTCYKYVIIADVFFFFLIWRRPPVASLFPYPTPFRSAFKKLAKITMKSENMLRRKRKKQEKCLQKPQGTISGPFLFFFFFFFFLEKKRKKKKKKIFLKFQFTKAKTPHNKNFFVTGEHFPIFSLNLFLFLLKKHGRTNV